MNAYYIYFTKIYKFWNYYFIQNTDERFNSLRDLIKTKSHGRKKSVCVEGEERRGQKREKRGRKRLDFGW